LWLLPSDISWNQTVAVLSSTVFPVPSVTESSLPTKYANSCA
jgi:hypothetical protein